MATIVLGALGAGIGALTSGGNPFAIQKGWAIGTTIGGLIEASNRKSVKSEVGKLTDLRYSGSNYGAVIPSLWGKSLVSSNVIWVANYINNSTLVPSGTENSTHFVEHKEEQSGGGGGSGPGGSGGSTTSYWYSASFAAAFCASSFYNSDGTFTSRNPVIKKIWANDILIYDADDSSVNKITVRLHYGLETDVPDSLIEEAEGEGNCPSYKGIVYAVVQNMSLKDYGNQLPSLKAEIWTDDVTVGDIISDISSQVKISGSRLDVSDANAAVKGYLVTNRGSGQSLIEPLLSIYGVDGVDIGGTITFISRGKVADLAVSSEDIGAFNENEKAFNSTTLSRGVRSELPSRFDLTYFDIDKKYEQVLQSAIKYSSELDNPKDASLQLTMTSTEAKQAAERILNSGYLELDPITIKLPNKFRVLTPTDVLDITYESFPEHSGRYRVVGVNETSFTYITVEVVKDDENLFDDVITGTPGTGGNSSGNSTAPVPCNFTGWSGRELREEDKQNCGFYVVATWPNPGKGGAVYYSVDSGVNWIYGGFISTRSIFGEAVSTLADGSSANSWDNSNNVDVEIINDGISVLQNTTEDGVLNGQNIAVIGDEILGFRTASITAPYAYTLTNLRRGIRGSQFVGHSSPELFVLATSAVRRVNLANSYAGTNVKIKVVASGQVLADVTAIDVLIAARNPTDIEEAIDDLTSAKPANSVYAGPVSGADAVPSFRLLQNADLPEQAQNTVKGRVSSGTGDVQDLTGTQINTFLPEFSSTAKGLVPAPNPSKGRRVLRENGTWIFSPFDLNIAPNPDFKTGDVTGWTNLTYSGLTGIYGSPAVDFDAANAVESDLFEVDQTLPYEVSFWIKKLTGSGSPSIFLSLRCYDRQGLEILPANCFHFAGTETTLAVALNPGDTTVTLTSATNWNNSATGAYKRIGFYPYTDSDGYVYEDYTYTRNISPLDSWAAGGISGNVITLSTPWAGPAYPIGTKVANNWQGSTYIYPTVTTDASSVFSFRQGHISPTIIDEGINGQTCWKYGTVAAKIRIFGTSGNTYRFSKIRISPVDSIVSGGTSSIVGLPFSARGGSSGVLNTGFYYESSTLKVAIGGTNVWNLNTTENNSTVAISVSRGPSANHYLMRNSSGVIRWSFSLDNAESGSNAGSSFILKRYDDSGILIGNVFAVTRNTGQPFFTFLAGSGNGFVRIGSNGEFSAIRGASTSYIKADTTTGVFATDVRATVLTGYSIGANAVLAATDTILGAFQKVQGQISAITTNILSTVLTGYSVGSNTAIAATDTVLQAFQKLQGQINAKEEIIASGTTAEYYRGDKTWRTFLTDVLGSVLTGLSTVTSTAVVATDSVIVAFGKLQAQIDALKAKKQSRTIVLMSGYTPTGTGADDNIIKLPKLNNASANWTPRRLTIRVETDSAGTSTVRCEYYNGVGAFSATNIHTAGDLSISGAGNRVASITTFSTTTLASDAWIRLNVIAKDATHAKFYVDLEIEEQ